MDGMDGIEKEFGQNGWDEKELDRINEMRREGMNRKAEIEQS